MSYYDEFERLEKEIDKKRSEYRKKKKRLSKELKYKQIAEERAVEVFNKKKDMIIERALRYFIKEMKIHSQYTERNGQFENYFSYGDGYNAAWLAINDNDEMFLRSEEARKSFTDKFCRLLKRELILNVPASYNFYVSLKNQTTEGKKFNSMISIIMEFLKEK